MARAAESLKKAALFAALLSPCAKVYSAYWNGERPMIKAELTLPEIGLIAATRGLLGAGIALLLADKLSAEQRNAVGWTLVGVGALTTIPLALEVFGKRE